MVNIFQGMELIGQLAKNMLWNRVDSKKLQEWLDKPKELAAAVEELLNRGVPVIKNEESILWRLYESDSISISARDGSRVIAKADSVFRSFLDDRFTSRGLDKCGKATEKTEVFVYELAKNATLEQMFDSFSLDRDALCLTQDQIIAFCEEHLGRLRKEGFATLFLFNQDDQFFVVNVIVNLNGLRVGFREFEDDDDVWSALSAHRLVVPQLKL